MLKKQGSIRWLPDAAIQKGSSTEATSPVEAKHRFGTLIQQSPDMDDAIVSVYRPQTFF
ncbi:hypothetical protein [Rhodanobacter sp. L36]|uniref:hypothetical protein n=1 Tax=Rhodanobacter sp. L36 TaxID=1747221 RepID=UPI00131C6E55|nr:hypothetical protein [Rhodanobacter sp. L36]